MGDLIGPVLKCFVDQDSRVRYYACESMYNIAKVGRGRVLPYFNDIFDGLCKVSLLHVSLYSLYQLLRFLSQKNSIF